MMRPEKDAPERLYGACGLKDLAGHGRVSGKEFLSGRKRAAAKPRPGTRTALYMRVSTADQKPDLQSDDLRGYAARAGPGGAFPQGRAELISCAPRFGETPVRRT